jgi:membrane-bound lytic murein transglycosylase D
MKTLFLITFIGLISILEAQNKAGASSGTNSQQGKTGNAKFEYYTVKDGETEETVAQKFGITVADLEKWNNLDEPISEGRILYLDPKVIKKPEESPAAEEKSKAKPEEKVKTKPTTAPATSNVNNESYHVVLPGETVYHISQLYKLTVQQLMDLNNLKTPTIKEGQKLRVKK